MMVVLMTIALLPGVANAAAPENDDFTGAKMITEIPYTDLLDATDATEEPAEQQLCGYYTTGTVWYSYTPSESVRLVADTFGSDYDTTLAVFNGPPSKDTMIACNDNWRRPQSRVSFDADSGTQYYFMVRGGGGALTFNLAVGVPPRNDEATSAKRIPVKLPWVDRATTTEATLNLEDPVCFGKSRTVWYRYVTPRRGQARPIEMSTSGSDYDTTLSVYTGRLTDLTRLRCDNNSRGYTSKVRFKAEPGKTYHVMVGSANNQAGGNLKFNVKQPPLPFRFSSSVSSEARMSTATGSATMAGTANCSRKATVRVSIKIRQKVGDHIASAYGSKEFRCAGPKTWSLTVFPGGRAFQPGRAGAWVVLQVLADRKHTDSHRKIVNLSSCSNCI